MNVYGNYHNIPSYPQQSQNKDLLYDQLTKELDDKYGSSDIQKKWKELEKKFKQEHSKALVKPSGSGTDEIYKPTFQFYNQLLFLTAICETDETMDSIEESSNPKPRKKSKRKIQEDTCREDRKLELMSEAIQTMKETPSTRMQDQGSMVENTEAVAFGTYVGLTLSKLSNKKFRQAKKCISDILYNNLLRTVKRHQLQMFLSMTINLKYKAGPRHQVALIHFMVLVTIQQYSTQAVTIIESIVTLMFTLSDI